MPDLEYVNGILYFKGQVLGRIESHNPCVLNAFLDALFERVSGDYNRPGTFANQCADQHIDYRTLV